MNIDLTSKVSWVTGGSRGIGAATAKKLASYGSKVAISYLKNEPAALKICEEITKAGGEAMAVQGDISNETDCQKSFDQIIDCYQQVDILVNAAGITSDNLLLLLSDEDWQKVIQTNLMGPVYTSKLAVAGMSRRRSGRIINISSSAGMKSGRGQANYAASKAGLEAMTRSLAAEVGKRGVTVNAVAPGVIETDMSKEVIALAKEEILQRQLIKRFGSPEEVASLVCYLASEQAAFITGQTLYIDGGLKMA